MQGQDADVVRDEVADVRTYLLRLADVLGMGLEEVVAAKIGRNAVRFPSGPRSD